MATKRRAQSRQTPAAKSRAARVAKASPRGSSRSPKTAPRANVCDHIDGTCDDCRPALLAAHDAETSDERLAGLTLIDVPRGTFEEPKDSPRDLGDRWGTRIGWCLLALLCLAILLGTAADA